MNAEIEPWRDFRQRGLGALAAGQAVGDDANLVATVDLAVGEIQDVTEDFRRPAFAPRAGSEAADLVEGA